jgi:hypothetical protein
MTPAFRRLRAAMPAAVSREGITLDQSPEYGDQNLTPPSTEPSSNAVRGWQSLAEKRGQDLEVARTELAAYRSAEKARQLASEYPDAAELALRDGSELSPSMENTLAAMQRAIDAEREGRNTIAPTNPRKQPGIRPEPSIKDLEQEAGDQLEGYLASRF